MEQKPSPAPSTMLLNSSVELKHALGWFMRGCVVPYGPSQPQGKTNVLSDLDIAVVQLLMVWQSREIPWIVRL